MKTHLLTTTIALLATAALAAEDVKKTETSTTVTTSGGKATIVIDVNGKKETREIDLGNASEIKIITDDGRGGGAIAVAGGSAGGTALPPKKVTWLGVAPEEVSDELRAQLPLEPGAGLIVRTVLPDSPAAKAGLQKNDVLTKLDDQLLTNPSQLRTLVSAKKDGDTVRLTYLRRGQPATLEAKLATHEEKPEEWPILKALPGLGNLFKLHSKAVVVDKDGKVLGGSDPVGEITIEKVEETLRDAGTDEKTIEEARRIMHETMKAVRDALSDMNAAKVEVQKGASDVAKALEQVRAAVEQTRKQAEEAVRKNRESRQNPPLEKQP